MTNAYADAEYTVPTRRVRGNAVAAQCIPLFGNDMLPRSALLPERIREAPVSHDYGLLAVQDAQNAGYLREAQDLAAELARVTASAAARGRDLTDRLRMRQFEAALEKVVVDAASAGVAPADLERALELGRAGAYWADRPAHRYLGRIQQLIDEIAGQHRELREYQRRVGELERRLAQAGGGED